MGTQNIAGTLVSAAYRDQDDAYFLLSRGSGKVSLYRVSNALVVEPVLDFADANLALGAELSISDEGLLAITRAGQDAFAVVLNVGLGLAAQPVTNLSGTGPLAIGALEDLPVAWKFSQVCPEVASGATLPELGTSGDVLLLWGTGAYRQSDVCFAWAPLGPGSSPDRRGRGTSGASRPRAPGGTSRASPTSRGSPTGTCGAPSGS